MEGPDYPEERTGKQAEVIKLQHLKVNVKWGLLHHSSHTYFEERREVVSRGQLRHVRRNLLREAATNELLPKEIQEGKEEERNEEEERKGSEQQQPTFSLNHLLEAAQQGILDRVSYILDQGVRVNEEDSVSRRKRYV